MRARRLFVAWMTMAGCSEPAAAEPTSTVSGFAVEGTLEFTGTGPLRIFIADRETYEKPMAGVQNLVIRPTAAALEQGRVRYRFEEVPGGTYAIRCFQDENDNGKLDRGAFGPKEPWGMSFRPGKSKRLRPPKFDEVSFALADDVAALDIVVD